VVDRLAADHLFTDGDLELVADDGDLDLAASELVPSPDLVTRGSETDHPVATDTS